MKAFQRVGPQLPEFPYPSVPHGKHPHLPQLFLTSCCFQTFLYNLFQLTYRPLKMWPQKVVWLLQTQLHDTSCDLTTSFLILSLYDDVLETSLHRSPFSLQLFLSWAGYVWLALWAEGQGILLWCYSVFFFFFLVGICFLFYPLKTWNLICSDVIRSSSSPSAWDMKKEPVRLVHGNISWIFWCSQLDVRHDWVHTHTER